jgi:hypothetical protein
MLSSSPSTPIDSPQTHGAGTQVGVMVPAPMPDPLTYQVADGQQVVDGSIVKVPLGKRLVLGTVWGKSQDAVNPKRLKPIEQVVDAPPSARRCAVSSIGSPTGPWPRPAWWRAWSRAAKS